MVALPFRLGLVVITWTWASGLASAQSSLSQALQPVKDRVPAGDVVYVTDTKDVTIKGRLEAVTEDEVRLSNKAGTRTIAAAEIARVQWEKRDSSVSGALIGAAIGAIPGVYWLIADPNECTGLCPEDYAALAVGTTVGWLIDRAIKKKVTVYAAAPSAAPPTTVRVGPLVTRHLRGVRLALIF